jgi:hypothetical protein
MRRILAVVLLTVAIAPTIATNAFAAARSRTVVVRVYDPYRRDYHPWDSREQRAYRAYLNERHRSYVAYRRQRLAERRAYLALETRARRALEHERR